MFKLDVVCPHCEKNVFLDLSQFIESSDVIEEGRSMGDEIEHVIECPEITCPVCKKAFCVSGSVFEYPPGACNDYELNPYVSKK